MNNQHEEYYKNLIEGIGEEAAIGLALAKVAEAVEDTQRIRDRVDRTLESLSANQISR